MSDDESTTRRAFLAAGVASVAAVSGCFGDGTETPTDASSSDRGAPDDTSTTAQTETASETRTENSTRTPPSSDEPTGTATEETAGTPTAQPALGEAVLVDQVGYLAAEEKVGIVRTEASTFSVRDTESGETVATGELSAPVTAESAGETVRHAEFGDVTSPGEYVLSVDSGAASYPFRVGEGVWGRVLAEVGRHYTLQRANTAIDDPITGLELEAGHSQDREARMYFADDFHDEGKLIDVHGGWYDAGDYGKYVPPAAVTVGQLLMAYEWNPDTFEAGQFVFPEDVSVEEQDQGLPDLLAEAKFELEWLERMQRPDGAVYHKVSGTEWPGLDVRPAADTQTRYVFGLSTYGTAMYAGVMAMAARIYDEFDSTFADRALENARSAFGFLEEHPDPIFRHDGGQNSGSGAYRKDTDAEERFWAAAELLKTTGEASYEEYLTGTLAEQFTPGPDPITWANGRLFGQWAYYTAEAGSAERQSAIAEALVSTADDLVDHVTGAGYRVSLTSGEYYWASAKLAVAKGNLLLLANEIESRDAYVQGALDQVHYVLGRSPTGFAYVTGVGEQPPRNPHDRIVQSTGTNVPGHLVGGPNDNGDDPEMESHITAENPPPAKAYVDDRDAYSVNEPAIDYAAPLVFALANFASAADVSVE